MIFFDKKPSKKNTGDNTGSSLSLSKNISRNIENLRNDFGESSDIVVNYIEFGTGKKLVCANVYIESLTDKNTLNSLSTEIFKIKKELVNDHDINFNSLKQAFNGLRYTKEGDEYDSLTNDLLSGYTIFMIDGYKKYFSVVSNTSEGRAVSEPTSQTIIRGPKDSFTENVKINIYLIRKRINNKELKIEFKSIGSMTKTRICLIYINKLAKDEIVQEVKRRLDSIEIDGVLEGGYIEELIRDDKYSIFPTFLNSEKPDSVVAALLEGRVAILVNGTPYVITAPALMVEFLQASEDYYHNFIISSVTRILRLIAFFLTLLVPAVYIAVTTFHQEMIPTALLVSIAAQREGVPFPTLAECLLMEFTFEILREAGIRMPRAIGPAISIVGALVLGQAAVEAGIISAAMVIVVSITAISSFAIPNYEMSNSIRLVRFILMILAGILGLYGVFMGLIILALHLCKVKSINVPYLSPVAPFIKGGNLDTFFRFPLWKMKYRPAGISNTNRTRTDDASNNINEKESEKPEFI